MQPQLNMMSASEVLNSASASASSKQQQSQVKTKTFYGGEEITGHNLYGMNNGN